MCRQVCALPEGDAGKLTKNYALAAVTSEAKQETSSVVTSTVIVDAKFFCKKHTDQKIVVYCKDCGVLACVICGLISHSKHTCTEVDEADKEFKNVLRVAAEKCKKTIGLASIRRLTVCDEKLREKQTQLATEERKLARFEALLNRDDASFIERGFAVKTLQLNQQRQLSRQQKRVVKVRRGGAVGVGNWDDEYEDYNDYNDDDVYNDYNDHDDYRDYRGYRGYND
jgi:hypothetical protein